LILEINLYYEHLMGKQANIIFLSKIVLLSLIQIVKSIILIANWLHFLILMIQIRFRKY